MPAATNASLPTAFVSEIPGRYAPPFIIDRRGPAAITASSATNSRNVFLPRAESINYDFQTPTNMVEELGTNYRVGEYDDLGEAKAQITSYDVGTQAISLITGIATPAATTTTFTANSLATAEVDLVMNYADPNGNVFYSEFLGDMVIDGYGINLKAKAAAKEDFSLLGFNTLGFRGFFVTKAYIVQASDVTANNFVLSAIYGANEGPVGLPVPGGSAPPSYWIQRGSLNFVKIERYRASTGWIRFKETTGAVATGVCKYTAGSSTLAFAAGDLIAGDLFFLTYATYKTNVVGYGTVPLTSLDTSDPVAVDTRLTPFTISGITQAGGFRGQSLDLKINLKRDRAEGIGDVDGLWGPPQQPDVTLGLDVKLTGADVGTLLQTGAISGTDTGGTAAGDFVDPNYMTRVMLNTATPLVAQINDPRNSGTTLKTVTSPTAVFKQRQFQAASKNAVTAKYTGSDRVGNITIAVTKP